MKKEDWDERLHYVRRRGSKELWSKPFPLNNCTKAILSPNARYIAFAGITAEGCCVELWDLAGKKLWVHDSPGIESFEFSPDSKFLVADWGGVVELIDLAGKTIFKEYGGHVVTSVANDASYISTFQGSSDTGVRLLDKRGNTVLKGGPDDLTLVSGDGAKGVLWDKDGAKIYSLPNKTLIKTYSIRPESLQTYFFPAAICFNGRYLVLAGSKISPTSQNNIFVVDLSEDKVWETRINEPKLLKVYITNDGKYFLLKTDGGSPGIESRLYYYQIF
jgi:WD40 repeat protein